MGNYLATPCTEKKGEEESNEHFQAAVTGMQGESDWEVPRGLGRVYFAR